MSSRPRSWRRGCRRSSTPTSRSRSRSEGAEVLYVPLVGEHAIIPAAKIFHAAGEDWTLSLFTATNHSYFVGDMAQGQGRRPTGSCRRPSAWASRPSSIPSAATPAAPCSTTLRAGSATRSQGIERLNIVPLTYEYLKQGKIRSSPASFDTPLTYHDSCSLGRSSGMYEEPRELIHAVATDYREMTPNRELNWCCGGGGGLIAAAEDMFEMRMKGGIPKVDQIRQTGAQWVVTACENCKTQLEDLNEHYELGVEIKGVIDLIADALIV